ncbi:Transposase and inactivated derivatives [Klebsiella pneumoniae]|uniref:Transposase and inactivated derivatives n=1 Tax=Klebsiella pneumoniae TaxID=573 RepID=A0A377YP80_KLEPN|nr:Transposase and inactivated derivatives [Klebsiella pneumoniae]
MIYTTNAIESLNSVIRHAIKKRKVFPTDDSVKKVVWLAIQSGVPEMDDAVEGLANGNEPLYYRVR